MSGPIVPPLTVSDTRDGGSVTGRPITELQVTDGTLTISGNMAILQTGGGGGSGTVTSITAAADTGTGTAITTSGTFTFTGGTRTTTSVSGTTVTFDNDAIEGTEVLSTGETLGTKFLREDGDGTSSWQTVSGLGDVVGPGSSVDSQVVLFDGTTGKLIKDGGKGIPTGAIVGTSDSQTLTTKTIDCASNTVSNYEGTAVISTGETGGNKFLREDGDGTCSWVIGIGDVVGPGSSVDGQVVLFDSTSGKLIKDGGKGIPTGAIVGTSDSQTLTTKTIDCASNTVSNYEGTAVISTGETGGNKYLREDGDGTSSWQTVTATVPDPLKLSDGAVTAPSYSFTSDVDAGMYLGGTGVLRMCAGSADFIEMEHDGTATRFKVGSGSGEARVEANGAYDLLLQTNGGTDSGLISIVAGTDGNISLTPDGVGTINFNGAYKFPIADGDANQVLTTNGAGTLTFEDAGGGGGAIDGSGTVGTIPVFVTDTTTIGDSRMTQPNSYETVITAAGGAMLSLKSSDSNEPNLRFLNSSNQGVYFQQAADGASLYIKPIGSASKLWKVTTGGAVTINDAYTLPTAVTGANDYVLTAQTDGSTAWAEAGGGGGGGMAPFVATAMATTHDTFLATAAAPYPNNILSSDNQTVNYDTPFYQPFVCPADMDVVNIQISVTSTAAATNCNVAIYSADAATGSPSTKLTTATFDVSSTGYKTTTLGATQALTAGTLYYLAYVRDASNNFVLRAHPAQACATGFITGIDSFNTPILKETGTDNALPATTTPANLETKYDYNAMIALGV